MMYKVSFSLWRVEPDGNKHVGGFIFNGTNLSMIRKKFDLVAKRAAEMERAD